MKRTCTILLILTQLLAAGCCRECQVPVAELTPLDAPSGTTTVTAFIDAEPGPPTPFVVANDRGQVLRARGPIDYRDPISGRFVRLRPGAMVAYTDGVIEVEIEMDVEPACVGGTS